MNRFRGSLALQQRVFPAYRLAFFEHLAARCDDFALFAGAPRPDEAILPSQEAVGFSYTRAHNLHISRGKTYLCYQRGLLSWLGRQKPDALVLEANPRYLSNEGAVRFMRRRSRPVLGWGLGAPPIGFGPLRWLRNRLLRRFNALIAYSTTGAQEYVRAGAAAGRVFVAINAALASPVEPPRRPREISGPLRVLFVGRLQRRKRVDLLLKACARVEPYPELIIVGDGPARGELAALSGRHFPQARFAGALQGEDLKAEFQRAELFVLPGTGGLAAQEAMAHGLPLMIGEGDGTQTDLVTPQNGWLLEPGSLESLTQSLLDASARRDELRRMGAESFRIVRDEVNVEAMADAFVEALHSVRNA